MTESSGTLIKLIDKANTSAMRELNEWELDWTLEEIARRLDNAADDPEETEKLKNMRREVFDLMKKDRED